MSTYTQILYHIIFSTKNRERTLDIAQRERILKYIWGIIKNTDSHLYQINLMEDHVHILCSIYPAICLSDFVKKIKTSSGIWMKEEKVSPLFTNWQPGYGAFTIAWYEKDAIIEYIKNQQEHHKIMDFRSEYKKLLDEFGIDYDKCICRDCVTPSGLNGLVGIVYHRLKPMAIIVLPFQGRGI